MTGEEVIIGQNVSRTSEVIRIPQRDVVLNSTTQQDQSLVQELRAIVLSGEYYTWPLFRQTHRVLGQEYHIDDPVNPRFFAKDKFLSDPESLQELLDDSRRRIEEARLKQSSEEELNSRIFEARKQLAYSSLVNEISISPTIVNLLGSPVATDIAIKSGFKGIEFVEPLVGVIEKEKGRKGKTMIYRFIDGRKAHIEAEQEALRRLSKGLIDLFLDAGVVPADLNPSQFLIGTNENQGGVYLLDSELYFKDK